ncbi:hypothetical protein ABEY96_28225 [Priestia aryabhattai]|uniref:hypothetical protein n=1 Tax=Priestia aryabhattai TaxID=412384 RepID=UPI003D29D1A3
MNNNLEKQLEKELERFLKENWKAVVPVGLFIGAGLLLNRYSNFLLNYYNTILPSVEKGLKIAGVTFSVFLILLVVRAYIVRKNEKKRYGYYQLLPRADEEVNGTDVNYLLQQLASVKRGQKKRIMRGQAWLHFLVHRDESNISFFIGCPGDLKNEFIQTFKNTYPKAEIHYVENVPLPKKFAFAGRMAVKKHRIKQWFPFASYTGGDQVANLLAYLPTNSWMSLAFQPVSKKQIGKKLFRAEKMMKKDRKYTEMFSFQKEQFKDITSRLTGRDHVYRVALSVAGDGKKRRDIIKTTGKTIATILNNKNQLYFKRHITPITFCPRPTTKLLTLTNNELANLLHLPDMKHHIAENILKLEQGQRHLDNKTLNDGVTVGYNLHPLHQEREVKISYNQLTEHAFLTGATGSGKSSLLIMALQSLINEWLKGNKKTPGFTLLDPAAATARTLLNRLMKAEQDGKKVPWEKVVYVSYQNEDFPVSINLLQKNKGENTDTVVQNAMSLFKTIYSADRTRIDKYLSNTLTILVEDVENHHVLSINRFMTDPPFRNKIISRCTDELLRDFWRKADPKELKAVATDIYSRLNQFEQSMFMRRVFGQSSQDLEIKKYMDEGYLVLLDIQGMGRVNTQFILGHLINQYHQICQRRRPYASREHLLIVDESHLGQVPVLEKIIAEDRKFNLALVLATQYFNQYQDWLKQAIDGNVQNIFTGMQGGAEAKIIAEVLMKKQFKSDLIAALPNNTAAILTKAEDKTLTTCLVKTTPPYLYLPDGSIAKYKNEQDIKIVEDWIDIKAKELQQNIGRPAAEIDKEINKYFNFAQEKNDEFFHENNKNKGGPENLDTEEKTCVEQLPLTSRDSDIIEESSSYCLRDEEKKIKEPKEEGKGEVETEDSFF